MTTHPHAIGEQVEVHAFGHWYPGQVVKHGRTKTTVRYTTGTGTTRDKAVGPDKVRAATAATAARKAELAQSARDHAAKIDARAKKRAADKANADAEAQGVRLEVSPEAAILEVVDGYVAGYKIVGRADPAADVWADFDLDELDG